MTLGISVYEIAVIVIICEFVLIAFVHLLFDLSSERFRWASYLNDRFKNMQIRLKQRSWTSRLVQIGWLAPLLITAIPFSGGVWTGLALSRVMDLSNKQAFWSVSIGTVFGCGIFLLTALGVLTIIDLPQA